MRSSGTSSSSPTIRRMAMRPPVPMSTLPTKTVTEPSACTARNESTASGTRGLPRKRSASGTVWACACPRPSSPRPTMRADVEARGRRVREQHGPELLRRPAIADRQLRRLDVAVGRAPRDGEDAALTQDRQPPPRLGDGHEVDLDAGGVAPRDLARELLGITLGACDLQRAALGEAEGLAGLVGERRELHHRALGEPRERRGRANLARQPGGARRGLRGEPGALEHRHAGAAARQVIRHARAEGAGADDDDVRRGDHRASRIARHTRSGVAERSLLVTPTSPTATKTPWMTAPA